MSTGWNGRRTAHAAAGANGMTSVTTPSSAIVMTCGWTRRAATRPAPIAATDLLAPVTRRTYPVKPGNPSMALVRTLFWWGDLAGSVLRRAAGREDPDDDCDRRCDPSSPPIITPGTAQARERREEPRKGSPCRRRRQGRPDTGTSANLLRPRPLPVVTSCQWATNGTSAAGSRWILSPSLRRGRRSPTARRRSGTARTGRTSAGRSAGSRGGSPARGPPRSARPGGR